MTTYKIEATVDGTRYTDRFVANTAEDRASSIYDWICQLSRKIGRQYEGPLSIEEEGGTE